MTRIAKQEAIKMLESVGLKLPVDVKKAAESLGIKVVEKSLEDDVSGMLIMDNGQGTIVVNEHHHPNRKRFTIAHELGHYRMHREPSGIFVDSKAVFYRDKDSMGATKEVEANNFAAELLMPEEAIRKILKSVNYETFDENSLKVLSDKFEVSDSAMTLRLYKLGIIQG